MCMYVCMYDDAHMFNKRWFQNAVGDTTEPGGKLSEKLNIGDDNADTSIPYTKAAF